MGEANMTTMAVATRMTDKTAEVQPPQFSCRSACPALLLTHIISDQNQTHIQRTGEGSHVDDPASEQRLSRDRARVGSRRHEIEQAG